MINVEKEGREEIFCKANTTIRYNANLIHTLQARASCIGSRHREGIAEVDRFYMHQRKDRGVFSFLSFRIGEIILDGTFVTPRLLSRACVPFMRTEESRL